MKRVAGLLPGVALSAAVTLAAWLLEQAEAALFGRAWLEALVLAIVLGTLIRTFTRLPDAVQPGVHFSAKTLLELAVALLGASVSAAAVAERGPALIGGIALCVALAISLGYAASRGFGLPHEMAVMVACGNAICGNSAIAAVAPVIDADGQDVAAAIGFTAVLGVAVVLLLPVLDRWLGLSASQYGVLAGMTVYAVPQVLAAASPVSQVSLHVGTLVKLIRVLMLGPVVLALSLLRRGGTRPPLAQLAPWFIVAFLLLMGLRSMDVLPPRLLDGMHVAASGLTSMSMAALGLGVDGRAVLRAGGRVSAAVLLSLLGLGGLSYAMIRLLGLT